MTEERIVETHGDDGAVHTRTTIVRDAAPASSGGAGKWVFLMLLAVVAVFGVVAFNQMSVSEVAKDNAIAGAAEDVGNAANQVGDAVEQGVDQLTN